MTVLTILKPGPLATLQDGGRFGMLAHGISASGPMDRGAYLTAGSLLGQAGTAAIEFTQSFAFEVDAPVTIAAAGGQFRLSLNGKERGWLVRLPLETGDKVEIAPGEHGNYGYLRFDREIDVAPVLGSRSTNVTVGLGGYKGRAIKAGDKLVLGGEGRPTAAAPGPATEGPIRFVWGIHADLFEAGLRQRFIETVFEVSQNLDRMGVRLNDPAALFRDQRRLTLVSDAIVPGDIQILGDGTPIVLMRDHQPTGGYPRIATIVTADLDRFAQLRPGTKLRLTPVTLEHAR